MIGSTVEYCQDRAFRRKVTGFLALAGMVSFIGVKKHVKKARNWAHGVPNEEPTTPSKWAAHDDTTRLPSRLSLTEMGPQGARTLPAPPLPLAAALHQ